MFAALNNNKTTFNPLTFFSYATFPFTPSFGLYVADLANSVITSSTVTQAGFNLFLLYLVWISLVLFLLSALPTFFFSPNFL